MWRRLRAEESDGRSEVGRQHHWLLGQEGDGQVHHHHTFYNFYLVNYLMNLYVIDYIYIWYVVLILMIYLSIIIIILCLFS